ncbi:ATP synthase protein I [Alteribacillus persepolensis]|uniref:ATP synthase protein I n=1 Tax=Alteribacillus persepolensis TaxID=568899 RepID=A0A1G8HCI3_9BACI|nr:ATP synthase subunit I [Alteribacillus persepolensis]SDI04200.1 ATP synthase protein I [Alteribacillus persepolensis]
MKIFEANVKRYVLFSFTAMCLYVLGWAVLPYEKTFFSLGTGTLIGLFNLWSMYREVKKFDEANGKAKRKFTFGMLSRFAAGALVAVLFIRFPENFHIAGLVAGFVTPYVIIFISSLFFSLTGQARRRGDSI